MPDRKKGVVRSKILATPPKSAFSFDQIKTNQKTWVQSGRSHRTASLPLNPWIQAGNAIRAVRTLSTDIEFP